MKPSLSYYLGVIFLWPILGHATPVTQDQKCFSNHIREALQINSHRKEIYRHLSRGRSDAIYSELMRMEKLTLPLAKWFDREASTYHAQGMNLLCSEFLPMKENKLVLSTPRPLGSKFNWEKYYRPLSVALKQDDFKRIREISIEAILELKSEPHFHCLVRHFFESIYRFAHFAPIRELEAQELHLPSPKKLIKKIIRGHMMGLWFANRIDKKSMPIQMKGIPMLCHELPPLIDNIHLDEI